MRSFDIGTCLGATASACPSPLWTSRVLVMLSATCSVLHAGASKRLHPSLFPPQVHVACQMVTGMAEGVAAVLGLPMNKVHVKTRRVGGGFGGKTSYAMRVRVDHLHANMSAGSFP